jgi:hypothetical protein
MLESYRTQVHLSRLCGILVKNSHLGLKNVYHIYKVVKILFT